VEGFVLRRFQMRFPGGGLSIGWGNCPPEKSKIFPIFVYNLKEEVPLWFVF